MEKDHITFILVSLKYRKHLMLTILGIRIDHITFILVSLKYRKHHDLCKILLINDLQNKSE